MTRAQRGAVLHGLYAERAAIRAERAAASRPRIAAHIADGPVPVVAARILASLPAEDGAVVGARRRVLERDGSWLGPRFTRRGPQ